MSTSRGPGALLHRGAREIILQTVRLLSRKQVILLDQCISILLNPSL